ncbi:MAG: glycosyltransferase family 4 protein, partial [Candidatus Omnitrophica bacterium]|nr:glycosyltransferase family 4 protein [Candidatus Omnitrophota bacterium]
MMGQGKTKVAMVEIAGRGGIWHYTLNLCGMLTRLSDLWVYTAKTYESTKDMDFHTRPVFNRFGTSLKDLIILVSGLRSEKFDIVHFQMSQHPEFVFLLLLLCRLFSKAKTVVTAHNIVDHENKAWLRPFFYMVYRYCDSV